LRLIHSLTNLVVVVVIQNWPDAESSAMYEETINWAEHAQRYFDRGGTHMTETFGQKDLAFGLARMWLRLHWFECFSKAPSRTDLARGIFDLKAAGLNIKGWMSASGFDGVPASSQQGLFERDYDQALEEAKLLQEMLELRNTERALRASNLSIMETRRGLKESHAIGRLTQLAFIFLPLTFITGVFGMNVKPFSDGAPMWKFWVTTCCILIPSWAFGIWTARFEVLLRIKHVVRWPADLGTWYRQNRRIQRLLVKPETWRDFRGARWEWRNEVEMKRQAKVDKHFETIALRTMA
jgi:CorA-like Mg2+ transporter protein